MKNVVNTISELNAINDRNENNVCFAISLLTNRK